MRCALTWLAFTLISTSLNLLSGVADDAISPSSQAWLGPQNWVRDLDEPTVSLGEPGDFDDTHLFAPIVVREDGQYRLWYCGSTGSAHDVAPTRSPIGGYSRSDSQRVMMGYISRSTQGTRSFKCYLRTDRFSPQRFCVMPMVRRFAKQGSCGCGSRRVI